jgi:hypothetical protein
MEMEREFEERVEGKRRRQPAGYQEPQKRERKKTKPPLLLRVLAWCGVILFCFVVGYVGTDYMVKFLGLDQPWPAPEENSQRSGDVFPSGNGFTEPESAAKLDMQKAIFSIFFPQDGTMKTEAVEVISRTLEDNIQEVVRRLLRQSGIFGDGDAVEVLHVFRDVDTVYLDFSDQFLTALNAAGERLASLLITGVVRTMNDNFSLTKVRFLVDSRAVTSGASVDLTAVWQLQK